MKITLETTDKTEIGYLRTVLDKLECAFSLKKV